LIGNMYKHGAQRLCAMPARSPNKCATQPDQVRKRDPRFKKKLYVQPRMWPFAVRVTGTSGRRKRVYLQSRARTGDATQSINATMVSVG
jgi:hypothetical protein